MRKSFAILLLCIHVFTLAGYRAVLGYLEHKADKSLVQQLDNNQYCDAELITIKIPLHMPYSNNKSSFERCDGTIQLNGIFYNYVKRKLANDTLILQCIANNEKSKLADAQNNYAKIAGDMPTSPGHQQAVLALLKLFFSEYNNKAGYELAAAATGASYQYTAVNDCMLCSRPVAIPGQPPETN